MKKCCRRFKILYVLPLAFISSMICYTHSVKADESVKSQPQNLDTLRVIGLINPDGGKSLWTVVGQSQSDKIIRSILEKYSSTTIDRVQFYAITSWEDMGRIIVVASEEQNQLILSLLQEVKRLKRRSKPFFGVSKSIRQHFRRLADKRNNFATQGSTP